VLDVRWRLLFIKLAASYFFAPFTSKSTAALGGQHYCRNKCNKPILINIKIVAWFRGSGK